MLDVAEALYLDLGIAIGEYAEEAARAADHGLRVLRIEQRPGGWRRHEPRIWTGAAPTFPSTRRIPAQGA